VASRDRARVHSPASIYAKHLLLLNQRPPSKVSPLSLRRRTSRLVVGNDPSREQRPKISAGRQQGCGRGGAAGNPAAQLLCDTHAYQDGGAWMPSWAWACPQAGMRGGISKAPVCSNPVLDSIDTGGEETRARPVCGADACSGVAEEPRDWANPQIAPSPHSPLPLELLVSHSQPEASS